MENPPVEPTKVDVIVKRSRTRSIAIAAGVVAGFVLAGGLVSIFSRPVEDDLEILEILEILEPTNTPEDNS